MDEKKLDASQEVPKGEKGNFFAKIGRGVVSGVKNVGRKIGEAANTVKENIEEKKNEKSLERAIELQFNASALKLTMVVPGEKPKFLKIYAHVDYTKKTLTFYGEVAHLTQNVYFIDEVNQKFEVGLIRLKQSIDIPVDNIVYPKTVSVVEYKLSNDDETKKQMQTIINNNQINITDSTITKSNIG